MKAGAQPFTTRYPTCGLDDLCEIGLIKLGRGIVISKKDIAAYPGPHPIYSSAKENEGKFGEYGHFMFDQEMLTWSVDGGGRFFYREKHKFSVTNVGGTLRITDTNKLDYRFLYFMITYLQGMIPFDWVLKAHPSVIRKLYSKIPLPPLDDQRRIVAVLDSAFAGIATATANTRKNLTNARALFETYLESIATGHGDGWTATPLGEICETQYGISGTMNTDGIGYKIFRMGEVQDGRMIDTGQMKYIGMTAIEFEAYRLRRGDVLFNRTNSIALVGKTGVFSLDGPYCFASYLIRVIFNPKKMASRFAGYVMNSNSFLERVRLKAAQSVNQANINATILRAEVISYPVDVSVQNEIIDRLDTFSEHIQALQAVYQTKLAALAELKQSLLQKAFAGELT